MSYNKEIHLDIKHLIALAMGREIPGCRDKREFDPYGKIKPRTVGYISQGMAVKYIGDIFLLEDGGESASLIEAEEALVEIMENSPLASAAHSILCERRKEVSSKTLASIERFEQNIKDASLEAEELEES